MVEESVLRSRCLEKLGVRLFKRDPQTASGVGIFQDYNIAQYEITSSYPLKACHTAMGLCRSPSVAPARGLGV